MISEWPTPVTMSPAAGSSAAIVQRHDDACHATGRPPVTALPARQRQAAGSHAGAEWAQIQAAAPPVAAVMYRYLRQLGTAAAEVPRAPATPPG